MRYVAPRVQGRSISSMLDEQLAVVKQQRAAMAEARRAQEVENRKFQYKQMENIYDFKLEGWNADTIADFQRLQKDAVNKLSTGQIKSMEELIAVKNNLVAVHNLYNQDGQISTEGRDTYQGYVDDPSSYSSDINVFAGDQTDLNSRIEFSNSTRFTNVDDRGNGDYRALNGMTVEDAIRQQNPDVVFQTNVLDDGSKVLINMSTNEQTVVRGQLQNHPHLGDRNMFTPPASPIGDITATEYLYDTKRSGKPGNYNALRVSTEAAVKALTTDITNAINNQTPLDQAVIDDRVQNIKDNTAAKILAKLQQTITVSEDVNGVTQTNTIENTNFDSLAYSNAIREWEIATGTRWNEDMRQDTISSRNGPVDIFEAENEALLPEEMWARDGVNSLNIEPKVPKKQSSNNQSQANAQQSFDKILAVTRQEDDNTIPNIVLNGATTRLEQANTDILNGLAANYRITPKDNIDDLVEQVSGQSKTDIRNRYNQEIARAYPGLANQINNLGNLGERITVQVPSQNTTFSVMIPGQGGQTGQKNFKSFDYYVGDDMAQGGGDDVLVLHMDQSTNYVYNRLPNDVIPGESGIIIVKESAPEFQAIVDDLKGELNSKHGGIVNNQGVLERLIIQKFQ